MRISATIERKSQHVTAWVEAYNLYRKNTIRLLAPYVWQVTSEGVEFVKQHYAQSEAERVKGVIVEFWKLRGCIRKVSPHAPEHLLVSKKSWMYPWKTWTIR